MISNPMNDQVLKNILARKNKLAPFEDWRKIAMVLYGGLMTGVRGAGALAALEELGLRNAFDDIYSISCGFANAASFLSGKIEKARTIYYKELTGWRFINFLHPWHILNIDYLDKVESEKNYVDIDLILQNKTRLYNRLVKKKGG